MNDKMHEKEKRAAQMSTTNDMTITKYMAIVALNESSITFVRDLSRWGWEMEGPGWEVYSHGEIRAFPIGDRKAAEQWRADEVSEYVALRLRTLA